MVLEISGAVAGLERDAAVAAHYGDPFREQRALVEQCGFVDRSHRGVIAVSGPDRLSWLHTLTTQHLEKLEPYAATEALVLSPQGRVEHHLAVTDDGDTTWLDTEAEDVSAVLAYLESMRFMLRVEPVNVTERWARLDVLGSQTPTDLWGVSLPDEQHAVALPQGGFVRRVPWLGRHDAELLIPRETLEKTVTALQERGVSPAGLEAYEALRVAARRPRLGAETDSRTIVQESTWINTAVHLNKGCYRGQETVAKVQNLGQSPRVLMLLHLDGATDDVPPKGEPVLLDAKQVGFIGTAVRHYELGNIALALMKRNVASNALLTVGSAQATIDVE